MCGVICLLLIAHVWAGADDGSADYPADLSKWLKTQPPQVGDGRWFTANYDVGYEWVVYLLKGRPSARPRAAKRDKGSPYPERQEWYPPMPFAIEQGSAEDGLAREWFSVQVSDGWIIGFNAGEWGGALWWYAPDGKRRYKISQDQIIGFFKTDAGVFALEGIAHLNLSRGQIVRPQKGADGRWTSSHHVDLGGAPETALLDSKGLLTVATHERLLRVNLATKKIEVLLENAFWGGLYPKSMILALSETAYIGMRHGVAEVESADGRHRARWLLPNAEFDQPREGFR
jgi:hypothetical protein